jgi:hypothetical protein
MPARKGGGWHDSWGTVSMHGVCCISQAMQSVDMQVWIRYRQGPGASSCFEHSPSTCCDPGQTTAVPVCCRPAAPAVGPCSAPGQTGLHCDPLGGCLEAPAATLTSVSSANVQERAKACVLSSAMKVGERCVGERWEWAAGRHRPLSLQRLPRFCGHDTRVAASRTQKTAKRVQNTAIHMMLKPFNVCSCPSAQPSARSCPSPLNLFHPIASCILCRAPPPCMSDLI